MKPASNKKKPLQYRIINTTLESQLQQILSHFPCQRCGTCCREASITVRQDELVTIMKREGQKVLDYLDESQVQNAFKPPCGLYSNEDGCRCYDIRPASCRLYPFAFWYGQVVLTQCCEMGKAIYREMQKIDIHKPDTGAQEKVKKFEQMLREKHSSGKEVEAILINPAVLPKFLKSLE